MEPDKIKILSVDDNPDNLLIIKALLDDLFPEVSVFTALTGVKGIELAAAEDPDVILLDIVMPEMDGFDVCKLLKADNIMSQIPVIFLTALKGDKDSRVKGIEAGGDAFLSKPVDKTELLVQVRAMVKIKAANRIKTAEKANLESLVSDRTLQLKMNHAATLNLLEDIKLENDERKKSGQALLKTQRTLILAQQISHIGSWNWDVSTNKVHWSDEMFSIFGIDPLEVKDQDLYKLFFQFIHPEDAELVRIANENATNDESPNEYRIVRKNGEIRYVSTNSLLIRDEKGNVTEITGVLQDITHFKNIQLDLIQAKEHAEESDRLKSAFLANMSHEIRTPMNGILGFTGLLKDTKLTGDQQLEYIGIIEKSGARMLNIINDIISISKVESGQVDISLSSTNINEQIEYLYTFFKPEVEKKGMQLFFRNPLPAGQAVIKTDKEKVYAILTNLVKNAIKFTHLGIIEFGYEKKNEYLEFFVKDTGVGILDEKKELIFERFRQGSELLTRNYEGAGLGLSISKAFVELLGGKLWVVSEFGQGSEFYFTIPYVCATEENSLAIHELDTGADNHEIKNLKILIAEDDENSAKLLSLACKSFAKEVIKVTTGLDAIESCRKHPDIDLVMMDVKMPVMDGYEAVSRIRKFNKNVVIIAQTAFGLSGDRVKAIKAGCNDYISKPIVKGELINLLRTYFRKTG